MTRFILNIDSEELLIKAKKFAEENHLDAEIYEYDENISEIPEWQKEKVRQINNLSDEDPTRLIDWDDVKDQFAT